MNKLFSSASILIGMVIGAGYLAIPYMAMKSGFTLGLLNLLVVYSIVLLTGLYLSEVIVRTKAQHQIVGYASRYLGKTGKRMMTFSIGVGVCSALVAYLTAQGESWSFLIFNTLDYSLHITIAFWIVLSAISYFGLHALKKEEPIGIILMVGMIILIAVLTANKLEASNLTYINIENIFIPFGVILFSFLGYSSIPEVSRSLGNDKAKLKKTVILGYTFVAIIYALFMFFVLGYQGLNTPEIATLVLGKPFIILGIITMLGAYLALSVTSEDILKADFGFSQMKAWLVTILVPLGIYLIIKLLNAATFSTILSVGGVISGGVTITTILFMIAKAKKHGDRKPEYQIPFNKTVAVTIILLLIVAVVLQIIRVFS